MRDWFAAFRKSPDEADLEQPERNSPEKGVAGCDTCGTVEITEEIGSHPDSASGVAECGTRGVHSDLPHASHPIPLSGVAAKVVKNQGGHTCHTRHTPNGNEPLTKPVKEARAVPSVEEFEERAAIIADTCGIAQAEVAGQAAGNFGFGSSEDYCLNTLSFWQKKIELLPAPICADGRKLIECSRSFLDSSYSLQAIKHGWTELELFGCHERAPLKRHDAMGLLPVLAWSRLGTKLIAIDHEKAVLETKSGSQLTHWRIRSAWTEAVVIWDHPLLVGDQFIAQL